MNNKRASDRTAIGRWYQRRVPEVHVAELITLATMFVAAITAWVTLSMKVEAHQVIVTDHESYMRELNKIIASQSVAISRIEQKVDYIREDVRAVRKSDK